MKAKIESTDKIVTVGSALPARIWEGTTESGILFLAFITHLEPADPAQMAKFLAEMSDMKKPSPAAEKIPNPMFP